jgi:hypothetical protein
MVEILLFVLSPYLETIAQDKALTLEVSRVVLSEDGGVYAHYILKYNKVNAGPILSRYCPNVLEIPSWGLPGSVAARSSIRIDGVPEEFLVEERYALVISTVPMPSTVLKHGSSTSGVIKLNKFFVKGFAADYRTSRKTIKISLSVEVAYLNKATGLCADRLPASLQWLAIKDFSGFDKQVGYRKLRLTSEPVEVTRRGREIARRNCDLAQ